MQSSGYTHCACRDCFEIVVSDDTSKPDYCEDCIEAGCNECQGVVGMPQECLCDMQECQDDLRGEWE